MSLIREPETPPQPLEILYQDDWYVVLHKPPRLLTHRTQIASGVAEAVLPMLRKQLGRRIYPIHRLDRGTSGVLVMGLSSEAAAHMSSQFEARKVKKTYLAVLRGWLTPPDGEISRPLCNWPGEMPRPAVSRYRTLGRTEIPVPVHPHQTSRYSLVEVTPETGRRQQIRRHFSGASHPVIGDNSHGDLRHNKVFRERFQSDRLLLMALEISFHHAGLNKSLHVLCPPEKPTQALLNDLFPGAIQFPETAIVHLGS